MPLKSTESKNIYLKGPSPEIFPLFISVCPYPVPWFIPTVKAVSNKAYTCSNSLNFRYSLHTHKDTWSKSACRSVYIKKKTHRSACMDLGCSNQKNKQEISLICTSNFRIIQILTIFTFHYRSLLCCHTLVKINNWKILYVKNHHRNPRISNRSDCLCSRPSWIVFKKSNANMLKRQYLCYFYLYIKQKK